MEADAILEIYAKFEIKINRKIKTQQILRKQPNPKKNRGRKCALKKPTYLPKRGDNRRARERSLQRRKKRQTTE
jgi:hypothetical protein